MVLACRRTSSSHDVSIVVLSGHTPSVNDYQRRVLGRVADEVDRYRAGQIPAITALNNCWGLFEAAQLPVGQDRDDFLEFYYEASTADDARQPWMPAGLGSDAAFEAALSRLADWSRACRAAPSEPTR